MAATLILAGTAYNAFEEPLQTHRLWQYALYI